MGKDIVIKYFDCQIPELNLPSAGPSFRAAIVYADTKGRRAAAPVLIELGVVVVEIQKEPAKIVKVISKHQWFEDPSDELSAGFSQKTGITAAMVQGQHIDRAKFEEIIGAAELVITYNAGSIRPALEPLFPKLDRSIFACLRNQIEWIAKDHECRSLEHLTRDHLWYFDGKRALDICAVLLRFLLDEAKRPDETYLQEIIRRANEPLITVEATDPYNQKGLLKKERFLWDASERTYLRCMGQSSLDKVRSTLRAKGYKGELVERETIPACERFKAG